MPGFITCVCLTFISTRILSVELSEVYTEAVFFQRRFDFDSAILSTLNFGWCI